MKKVYLILGLAFLIITACMIYLVRQGVSLRTEPLIKPSPIDLTYNNISYGLIHRLVPNFQVADYVVWGISPYTSEEAKILELLQAEHEKQMGPKPTWLQVKDSTTSEDYKNCLKPCWILVDKDKANQLGENTLLNEIKTHLGENYFSITVLGFDREQEVPEACDNEKRLEYSCILPVSVREVRRRFKDPQQRYFFMRRYNEKDHFLFLQNRPAQ